MKSAHGNNLYAYFFFSQLIFLPVYFYQHPLISASINTDRAIWMHMIGLSWSAVGYFTARYAYVADGRDTDAGPGRLAAGFYLFSYGIMIVGVVVSALQVFLFVPPAEYLSQIFSSAFEATIRDTYLLPSEEEGLPGIVKMLGYAPLSIYLMSLGILHYSPAGGGDLRKLTHLSRAALCLVVIKVLFSLDRLSVMAVLLANLFLGHRKGYLKNLRYAALVLLTLLLADYLSAKKTGTRRHSRICPAVLQIGPRQFSADD